MKSILKLQQQAFIQEGFVTAATRVDRLNRVCQMIGHNQKDIIEACNRDFGNHSKHQAQMSEVMAVMSGMQLAIKQLKKWMRTDQRKVMFPLNILGASAKVENIPQGCYW